MKVIAILQARMGSTRLPGKVLLPFGRTNVLDYAVSRCQAAKGIDQVIVATSEKEADSQIVEWCNRNGIEVFQGSEEDVLSRYFECAKQYKADYVIRALGDCPFFHYELADAVIEHTTRVQGDIAIYSEPIPLGLGVEIISSSALSYIYSHGMEDYHREHVTYYAYENRELFQSVNMDSPAYLKDKQVRLTLDTQEDYQLLTVIANHFAENKLISTPSILNYLEKNKELTSINEHIEQKKVK
jgi:spore coat polysaccharide biosynthesis protein SpsF